MSYSLEATEVEETIEIYQRRYLGNKAGVLDLIDEVLQSEAITFDSFCDIFAGTGTVGHYFNSPSVRIISNDLLYSNYITLYAWLSPENCNMEKVEKAIDDLNVLEPKDDNYVSQHFGDAYFSYENAIKIGVVREAIEEMTVSLKEKAILLSSLLYAMDRVANTVGHYDAYRANMDSLKPLELRLPNTEYSKNTGNQIFNEDANSLVRRIKCDVLYLDPPYNSRQYCDLYHVLENIMRWEKPAVYGKAKKFDRHSIKSKYNLKDAPKVMADLVGSANAKYILLSYNNMGDKGDPRSNARITDRQIMRMLTSKGRVEVYERDYRIFTAGKSDIGGNRERVFFCEVKPDASA